jgi:hypothetical protein
MREQVKFTSLIWLVGFLNLKFDSDAPGERQKVESLLAGSWPDTRGQALEAQQKFVALIDEALKCQNPEGLVMALNNYVMENSETRDPLPVRAHWYCRPVANVAPLDAKQTLLAMGSNKWVVESRVLMHGIEGHVWQSVAQCLVNGDFGRLRRCSLVGCKTFFETKDARQRFCTSKHQRALDREAAKVRVRLFRERQKAKAQGLKPPARESKAVPKITITEAQRFGEFLKLAHGNSVLLPDTEEGLFIKRKLPGEWNTVFSWLKDKRLPDAIWDSLTDQTKDAFRYGLWTA